MKLTLDVQSAKASVCVLSSEKSVENSLFRQRDSMSLSITFQETLKIKQPDSQASIISHLSINFQLSINPQVFINSQMSVNFQEWGPEGSLGATGKPLGGAVGQSPTPVTQM